MLNSLSYKGSPPGLHSETLLQETKQIKQIICGLFYNPLYLSYQHKSPFLVSFSYFPKPKFLNYRKKDSLGQLSLFWGTLTLPCKMTVLQCDSKNDL